MSHEFTLRVLRVKLCLDQHLCSRMLCFDVYYTMTVVFCQVFVTFFLKVFLRSFVAFVRRCFVCVVSIGAFVFGACRVFAGFATAGFRVYDA